LENKAKLLYSPYKSDPQLNQSLGKDIFYPKLPYFTRKDRLSRRLKFQHSNQSFAQYEDINQSFSQIAIDQASETEMQDLKEEQ